MRGKKNQYDSVFRMLFSDKTHLLSLYNAVSGKDFTDPNEIEITTLENAVFMNRKNDLSFILHTELWLFEHQTTVNPNMPLRDLLYVTDVLKKQIQEDRLYDRKKYLIPVPHFFIFYNGLEKQKGRRQYKLSDLYTKQETKPDLELIVHQININKGSNKKLVESCQMLREYQQYVECVRKYVEQTGTIEDAVPLAVDECINKGILEDFLRAQKREVIALSIYEYNEERHMQYIREEGFEEGVAQGVDQERVNTERERKRADQATLQASQYKAEAEQLRALLREHGIDPAVH